MSTQFLLSHCTIKNLDKNDFYLGIIISKMFFDNQNTPTLLRKDPCANNRMIDPKGIYFTNSYALK